jgi:hypothetical protein
VAEPSQSGSASPRKHVARPIWCPVDNPGTKPQGHHPGLQGATQAFRSNADRFAFLTCVRALSSYKMT